MFTSTTASHRSFRPAVALHRAVATLALAAALVVPAGLRAQTNQPAKSNWEFMMSSGALVPTGAQRHSLKDAQLSTAQLSYVVASRWAVTAMGGWARSRDLAVQGNPRLDVFTYDIGVESRLPRPAESGRLTVTPLFGIGAGARSYNHRNLDTDATHHVAAYASVGGELGVRRVRVRLELRDYITRSTSDVGIERSIRNDVIAMLGLRVVRRGS